MRRESGHINAAFFKALCEKRGIRHLTPDAGKPASRCCSTSFSGHRARRRP